MTTSRSRVLEIPIRDAADESTLRSILRGYVQERIARFEGAPADCLVCHADLLAGETHERECPVGVADRILKEIERG